MKISLGTFAMSKRQKYSQSFPLRKKKQGFLKLGKWNIKWFSVIPRLVRSPNCFADFTHIHHSNGGRRWLKVDHVILVCRLWVQRLIYFLEDKTLVSSYIHEVLKGVKLSGPCHFIFLINLHLSSMMWGLHILDHEWRWEIILWSMHYILTCISYIQRK